MCPCFVLRLFVPYLGSLLQVYVELRLTRTVGRTVFQL